MNLAQTAGKYMKDRALFINREEFASGYTVFTFDLSPDKKCGDHYSLIKTRSLRAAIHFARPFQNTVNMIVYRVFDNIIEVNQRRNVLFDYM